MARDPGGALRRIGEPTLGRVVAPTGIICARQVAALDALEDPRYPAPMHVPNRLAWTLAALILTPASLAAQAAADSGTFVVRHSGDTVATERFSRTQTSLQGTLALRNAKRTSQRYNAVVAPDATLPLIEVTVREDADSGRVKSKIVQRARVIFKNDSAAVDDVTGNGMVTQIFGTRPGAVPYLNLSFALLEQAIRRARTQTDGLREVAFFNLGGGQTVSGKVSRLDSDSLALDIGRVVYHLRVDPSGRLLGGRIPAQDVVAERQ
jgi:hypothetical protein